MKKVFVLLIAVSMVLSITACGTNQQEVTEEVLTNETEKKLADWEYDASSKTLYVNVDMGAFEPDAENEESTTTNAPWAEFLPEIENIVVGEKVTVLGEYAFALCSSLKNVNVSENVNTLDYRCFYRCGDWENGSELTFTFDSTAFPMMGEDTFGYTWDNANAVVFVPDECKEQWANSLYGYPMYIDGYQKSYDLNDPMSIVSVFLNDPQMITGGTPDSNMKEDFSFVEVKKDSWDGSYVEFGSNDEGAYFKRNESLFYNNRNNCQAIMVKFMPNDTQDLNFTIMNDNEISLIFKDGIPYYVNMHNYFEAPYSDFGPANIMLELDKWYWAMMAVDGEGSYRSLVWQEDDAMIGANCTEDTGIPGGEWIWNVSFGANQTLYMAEYIVLDFDGFTGLNMQGNQDQAEDVGPSWNIMIGGNFDIMGDMVWQSVELQDIEANGDTYKGYNLADMMNFSGNGSDTASVTFGADGVENAEIEPTYDAYIVFKKNEEFLGGPFLLCIDGLSDFPVIEVNPN